LLQARNGPIGEGSMVQYPKPYDVLVVGGGHAGVEAALASARLGAATAMVSQNLDTIGQMSCNPAIGGLGKGHMVREIDALGGAMALNTDATALQFRMLNVKKGPSVRAPRAQCDKKAYQFRMKWLVETTPNLDLHQGNISEILVENDAACGVRTKLGIVFRARTVVITTGTFMRGLMHVGLRHEKGGRMGDGTSTLSENLKDLGFVIDRFKTGTPARLNGRSIDFSRCERQDGDTPPPRFSFRTAPLDEDSRHIFTLNRWEGDGFHVEQLPCWTTYTNPRTHDVIRDNLDRSPMYSGTIEGVGPRYCPSIEDKVMRFADKERHQIFLEPEGLQTTEYYVNGVSTSLPFEVQYEFLHSIAGLESCEIIRPGYAVEYDSCDPTQLVPTLETKRVENLFLAGQINGTSGYEEAAGQGLVAGANAALKAAGKPAFTLQRSDAYIGVMIDDLVTKGTTEPYRMFTSRAEYRLLLRQDSADLRLTPVAARHGLATEEQTRRTEEKATRLKEALNWCSRHRIGDITVAKWFRRPENTRDSLPSDLAQRFEPVIWELAETELKYEGYVRRQHEEIAKTERMESAPIPPEIDYAGIHGLKKEAHLRLAEIRPRTLGQASRISGITPADISILAVYLERQRRAESIGSS